MFYQVYFVGYYNNKYYYDILGSKTKSPTYNNKDFAILDIGLTYRLTSDMSKEFIMKYI